MNLNPLTGASRMSSSKNICSGRYNLWSGITTFQFEPDVHKIIGGPRSSILERELTLILGGNLFYLLIKLRLVISFNQKSRVHDHSVADRFVCPRGDSSVA